MSRTATAEITASLKAAQTNALSLATYSGSAVGQYVKTFTTAEIDTVYQATTSFSTSYTIDLTDLVDDFGALINLSDGDVLAIYIKNTHATNTMVVGGGTTPALGTDQYTITAGGNVLITSTFAIDATHFNLKLTAAAGSFQVIILGLSDA